MTFFPLKRVNALIFTFINGMKRRYLSGNKTEQKGVVKFFNQAKGFGFIKTEDGTEVFVHVTALRERIRQSDTVRFNIQQSKKGPTAVNVCHA